jgi:DNA polymerase-4
MDRINRINRIRDRHGDRSVMRVSGMPACSADREARTISRFNPFTGEPPPLLANRRV